MPRLATNYQNIIIYKLVCCDLSITDVYVGSTTQFSKRKNAHKTNCNNETSKGYNLKLYSFIRENGGWLNFNMVEIEKFPCQDGNEAHSRERYWIELLKSNLNMRAPIITTDERIENKKKYDEINKEKKVEYYQKNKEKKTEYNKQYNEVNKEQISFYKKQYYQNKKIQLIQSQTNISGGLPVDSVSLLIKSL